MGTHLKKVLKGCQATYEDSGRSDNVEITCQGGSSTHVNILVFASLCQPWIRDVLKKEQHCTLLQVIMPSVNIADLVLFLTHVQDPQFSNKSASDLASLQCSIANLSPYLNLESLKKTTADDPEPPSSSMADLEMHDLTEDFITNNFSDQNGRLVCLICYKMFKADSFDMFKSHVNLHPAKLRNKVAVKFNGSSKTTKKDAEGSSSNPRQCQLCHKTFSDSTRLKNHLKTTHTGIKPWTCHLCQKSFSELRSLKEHKLIHDPQRQHQCQICDKQFVQKNHLLYHQASRHGLGEKCQNCDRTFAFPFQLKKHTMTSCSQSKDKK